LTVGKSVKRVKKASSCSGTSTADRLESLGTLAGGVAHDINNILASVMVVASAMESEMAADNPFRDDVRDILDACVRGTKLTRGLLHFARRHQIRWRPFCLNTVVEETVRFLSGTSPAGIEVSLRLCPSPLSVSGDTELLAEAIMNVCRNGLDSMTGPGTLTIETSTVTRTPAECPVGFDTVPGEFARIAVMDTGCGMPPEVIDRAFEPFFTTKQNGKGAGLGLAITYGAVRKHRGVIEIESAADKGTTVRIDIPLTKPE
jgi:signal transduction histidine kinase